MKVRTRQRGSLLAVTLACGLAIACHGTAVQSPVHGQSAEREPAVDPAPATPKPVEPTDPDRALPREIVLPYEPGTPVHYTWSKGGSKVGEHVFQWDYEPKNQERIVIVAKLHFLEPGREFFQDARTTLTRALTPAAYEHRRALAASGVSSGESRVEATFADGVVSVLVHTHKDKPPIEHVVDVPDPAYLYETQAFEHWAVLAPVLHRRGEGTYDLLAPSAGRIYRIAFHKVRVETVEGRRLERWDFRHAEFNGSIWLRDDGSLEKYQQGEFEAVRTE